MHPFVKVGDYFYAPSDSLKLRIYFMHPFVKVGDLLSVL